MMCYICGGILISESIDSRQEWSEEYLTCNKCNEEFTIRTEYKEQSNLVKSQNLFDKNNNKLG